MISQIITLCATLIVLWCIVYWSRERVFKYVLVGSIALHAMVFVPLKALNLDSPEQSAPLPMMQFTFVQGVSADSPKPTTSEKPIAADGTDIVSPDEEPETVEVQDEDPPEVLKEEEPIETTNIDPELPEIADTFLFAFSEHPEGESYRKAVKHIIKSNLEIPREILEGGYEGKQVVYFKLSRDGKLLARFIDSKYVSSDPLVNETSLSNIDRISAKFPPLPRGVKDDEVWFKVEIDYAQ